MDYAVYLREVSVLRLPHSGVTNKVEYRITLRSMMEGYAGFYTDTQSMTLSASEGEHPLEVLVKMLREGMLLGYFNAWVDREYALADHITFYIGRERAII